MWNKIQKQLEIQNKTAYWLAKQSGIPIQTIYSLRNNDNADTSFHNMERIANTLDVSLDEFRTKKNA